MKEIWIVILWVTTSLSWQWSCHNSGNCFILSPIFFFFLNYLLRWGKCPLHCQGLVVWLDQSTKFTLLADAHVLSKQSGLSPSIAAYPQFVSGTDSNPLPKVLSKATRLVPCWIMVCLHPDIDTTDSLTNSMRRQQRQIRRKYHK